MLRSLILLTLAGLGTSAQAQLLTLRQHWKKGYSYTLQTQTDTVMPDTNAKMSVTQTTLLEAKPAQDLATARSSTELQVTFTDSVASMTGNGQTVKYNSKDIVHSHPALVQSLGSALNRPFTLVYDERDRFKEVKDLNAISTAPGIAPGLMAIAESRSVSQLFRQSLEIGLPTVPVAVGSTWTADQTLTFASLGEVQAEITGKLLRIEENPQSGKKAIISFDGKMRSPAPKEGTPKQDISITPESSISGKLHFDLTQRIITLYEGSSQIGLSSQGKTLRFIMKEKRQLLRSTPTAKTSTTP
jgi:hypothetical protein